MANQVLARKWRPRAFSSLVGQDHVVRALSHALETQRLHHAYLFTGTRGVGKTTIARILAKSLNCEKGISATPCGVCPACVELDQGRFPDYLELDAASNRGVEEMTQLLEAAVYAPTAGRYKVYVIDEVHMLSNHAFNAMLKTLEEPPPHVIFILATTDPQKVPVTVLSRCMQFNLKNMPVPAIVDHLAYILGQEAIAFDAQATTMIARSASGSMRDALSILDQAIAFGGGCVDAEAVALMLGAIDKTDLFALVDALVAGDGAAALARAQVMLQNSVPFDRALADLAALLHRVALAQVATPSPEGEFEAEALARLAHSMAPETVQALYQIAIFGQRDLPLAPDPLSGFTMTLLRMMAFLPRANEAGGPVHGAAAPAIAPIRSAAAVTAALTASAVTASALTVTTSNASLANKPIASLRPATASGMTAKLTAPPTGSSQPSQPVSAQTVGSVPVAGPRSFEPSAEDLLLQEGGDDGDFDEAIDPDLPLLAPTAIEPTQPTPAQQAPIASPAANSPAAPVLVFDGNWAKLAAAMPLSGLARQLATTSELVSVKDDYFEIRVATKAFADAANVTKLRQAMSDYLGRPIRLNVLIGSIQGVTAAAVIEESRSKRLAQASAKVAADPFVQSMQSDFGATIVPGSIQPIE